LKLLSNCSKKYGYRSNKYMK